MVFGTMHRLPMPTQFPDPTPKPTSSPSSPRQADESAKDAAKSAANKAAEARTNRVLALIVGTMMLFTVGLPIITHLIGRSHNETRLERCMAEGTAWRNVSGTVAHAAGGMYLKGDSWYLLGHRCQATKNRSKDQCLAQNEKARVLEQNLGGPVSALLCGREVVHFDLAGQRFVRHAPPPPR